MTDKDEHPIAGESFLLISFDVANLNALDQAFTRDTLNNRVEFETDLRMVARLGLVYSFRAQSLASVHDDYLARKFCQKDRLF